MRSCGEFLLNGVFCRYHPFQPQSGIYELRIGQNRHVGELHQPNIESNKDDSLSKKLSVPDFLSQSRVFVESGYSNSHLPLNS